MRIFYDGFIYDFQQYGGINRYHNELIRRLPGSVTPIVSTFLGQRDFWPEHPNRRLVRSRPFAKMPALAPFGRAWMGARVSALNYDLAHPTYYELLTPGGIKSLRRPLVVTVHDMIHEIFASELDPSGRMAAAKRACIEAADAILCNSENTRADLLARFPAVEKRVLVTPLAASIELPTEEALNRATFDRPYFVYVGGRDSYKNFGQLLRVWKTFSARHRHVDLRVVGSKWLRSEEEFVAQAGLGRTIIHQGKASDALLAALYRNALGLVYPSRYEGFGIPPLEAMVCGTAVICAACSSVPEVCGDAALYFSPDDDESLLHQLNSAVENPTLRTECIQKGLARAVYFSWDRTANLTWKLYQDLAHA
jgi:glycosyltransferase involved in cell wall biosynthesis